MRLNKNTPSYLATVTVLVIELLGTNAMAQTSAVEAQALERRIGDLERQQREWISPDSTVHLAGYAAAGYVRPEGGDGQFGAANFNPIFHYQYKDILLFESELEIELGEDGETEFALEYSSVDLLLNDHLTLLVGKFQSPVGNFRQNLHPAWINKLPSAPPGFGHDGAAPLAEVGVQARGGWRSDSGMRLTYALFLGNGPELELAGHADEGSEDGHEDEEAVPADDHADEEPAADEHDEELEVAVIEALMTEGFGADRDGNPAYGGRLGLLPWSNLELGLSWAGGAVALPDEADRDHTIVGADLWWQLRNLELRAEYVRSEVAALDSSAAPDAQHWRTFYAQAAYALETRPWEFVVRYTDFDSSVDELIQEQWAYGINYLLAPSVVVKLAFESNEGSDDQALASSDRWLSQVAYGF